MIYVIVPHKPEPSKVMRVKEKMRRLGRPRIRAHWNGGAYTAIEGSHRIAAARELGINPIIDEIDEHQSIHHDIPAVRSSAASDVLDYIWNTADLENCYAFAGEYYYDFQEEPPRVIERVGNL